MIRDPALHPNHPFVEFPFADTNQTIARRFEQQARRYPERLALKAGRRALSYAELNGAADQVARVLAGDADRPRADRTIDPAVSPRAVNS